MINQKIEEFQQWANKLSDLMVDRVSRKENPVKWWKSRIIPFFSVGVSTTTNGQFYIPHHMELNMMGP
jgi:hypothetical protein